MSKESLHNESELVQEMQSGSEEAFTTLYHHYSPRLYRNMLGLVKDPLRAEEMVQELFTRIWQNRESKGITENFAGYMYRVGLNLAHDFFRGIQRDRKLMEQFKLSVSQNYEPIEEAIHNRQATAVLKQAVDQLSPQQKKVYELVKIEGYTYKKTAEIMNISAHTVKEYLVAAHKSLRNYLADHIDDPFVLVVLLAVAYGFDKF